MTETSVDSAHDRRRSDDLDWASILIGTVNPKTGKTEGGLVDSVGHLVEYVAFQRRVDSWILRIVALVLLARFLGADHIWQLKNLLWP